MSKNLIFFSHHNVVTLSDQKLIPSLFTMRFSYMN